MSVCFFVNADQGTVTTEEDGDIESTIIEDICVDPLQQRLHQFWNQASEDIRKTTADDFKTQALPLARIKKIMKLDEEVKMISAEAPVLFAKAAELFIHELTLRAWSHTEDNKRRTLQRNDIAMAISKSDQFDFLIDIVPRHETTITKPKKEVHHTTPAETVTVTQNASVQNPTPQQIVLQPYTQIVQPTSATSTASTSGTQQPVVLQQVVGNNEVQLPIQLTQAQLNMLRFQMQNNPSQPFILQAAPQGQQGQQLIQVSQQPQQQVFLQVGTQEAES